MAEVVYNRAKLRIGQGLTVLDSSTLRVLVLRIAPIGVTDPDLTTITALLAVATAAEASGTGYTRKVITGASGTQNNTADRADFDAADVTWVGANWGNFTAVVFYDEGGGTDATRYPLLYSDTNAGFATNGGDVTMTITDFLRLV